jgi:hypothetical protein
MDRISAIDRSRCPWTTIASPIEASPSEFMRRSKKSYSIISSACAGSVGGTVSPSALAVLRLIIRLSENSPGKSPRFSPLFETYNPIGAWRRSN